MTHNKKGLAPLVVFAYRRPDHTARTLAALQKNQLAPLTDIIIYIDGPRTQQDTDAVRQTKQICENATGFASVTVNASTSNKGLASSIIDGVSAVMEEYGKAIVLEDDIVTTPHFLSYMNDALRHYEHDPCVFSIGGYSYPKNIFSLPKSYPFDTYASYRCCSWGWACWSDRWSKVDWSMTYYDSFMKDAHAMQQFNRSGPDMTTLLRLQHEGNIDSWAIRFCYAHHENNMHCIYPKHSLGNNIGLDNSGVHCKSGDPRAHINLRMDWQPTLFCPGSHIVPEIINSFYSVFASPQEPTPWREKLKQTPLIQKLKKTRIGHIARKIKHTLKPVTITPDILFINTTQKNGGAARAAWRLFQGVRTLHPNTRYLPLLREDYSIPDGWHEMSRRAALAREFMRLDQAPLKLYPHRSNEIFSPAVFANPLRQPFRPFKPSIVHLHWVTASMLKPNELREFNAPIVWTLHDTWAFTGGCHYTGSCTGYMRECGCCPVLGSTNRNDLSHLNWLRKSKAYAKLSMTIVTPSRWLADMARQSSLFHEKRIEVIPNGLDLTIYKPLAKEAAQKAFGFTNSAPVIAFGAQSLNDPRKGMELLIAALAKVTHPHNLLTFGEGAFTHRVPTCREHRHVGTLHDDISLALLYNAADVFVCPSREDNLPNTVAEALSCGTPCVAFAQGGLREMIRHKETGWLATPFKVEELAAGIEYIISTIGFAVRHESARSFACAHYDVNNVARNYLNLYESVKTTNATRDDT